MTGNDSESAVHVWYPSSTFITTLTVVVIPVCVLSILGASLIILTYVFYKDLRTTARQLLVNLSVADIIVAASNLAGLFIIQGFVDRDPSEGTEPLSHSNHACKIQGMFSMFGFLSSFLWTVAIAVYMFAISASRRALPKALFVIYSICWGIPLAIVIAFAYENYFAYTAALDPGWCYTRVFNSTSKFDKLLPQIIGYDIWYFPTIVILPMLYVLTYCYLHFKFRGNPYRSLMKEHSIDMKLLLIPIVFILLKIWSAIINIVYIYGTFNEGSTGITHEAHGILIFLTGIGDSSQGLANAIIFCLCTRQVRDRILQPGIARGRSGTVSANPLNPEIDAAESTTKFNSSGSFHSDESLLTSDPCSQGSTTNTTTYQSIN